MQIKLTYKNVLNLLPLIAVGLLVVILFPHSGNPFPYEIIQGSTWSYNEVKAEVAFDILKSEEDINKERKDIPDYPCCRALSGTGNAYVVSAEDKRHLEQTGATNVNIITDEQLNNNKFIPITTLAVATDSKPATLVYDESLTKRKKEYDLKSVRTTSGHVEKGTTIIDRGEVVTPDKYRQLISLQKALKECKHSKAGLFQSTLGDTILIITLMALFIGYLYTFQRKLLDSWSTILFFALQILLVLTLTYVVLMHTSLNIFLVPFIWVPVITLVFFDSRTAFMLHLTCILIVSLVAPIPYEFVIIQFIAGLTAVLSLKDMSRRAQLAKVAGLVFVISSLTYTTLIMSRHGAIRQVDYYVYLYLAISSFLILGAYGMIYVLEKLFNLVSSVTLVELTDINTGLMHELADRAPGTFQHSMQVSNLATEAAKKIGANVQLVRTGALYHDIGKLMRPEYFTENQQDGQNPLLALSSMEAAKIVIAHVSDGVELAKRHHLPSAIIHFIQTHHGDSLTRYFYNTYVNEHPAEEVDPHLFQYAGPRPDSRETAILMMADVIEAVSRSLPNPTEESISQMVDRMIDGQIKEGMFDNAPLTMRDITEIRSVFKTRLISINHHRIQYPTLNKQ